MGKAFASFIVSVLSFGSAFAIEFNCPMITQDVNLTCASSASELHLEQHYGKYNFSPIDSGRFDDHKGCENCGPFKDFKLRCVYILDDLLEWASEFNLTTYMPSKTEAERTTLKTERFTASTLDELAEIIELVYGHLDPSDDLPSYVRQDGQIAKKRPHLELVFDLKLGIRSKEPESVFINTGLGYFENSGQRVLFTHRKAAIDAGFSNPMPIGESCLFNFNDVKK